MLHILNLFGRSPFAPLQGHMEKVKDCVHEIEPLFQLLLQKNYSLLNEKAAHISELEHAADRTKNDIRNHLPGSLFLSIDRDNFLQILALQDSIADRVEDTAVLLTLRELVILPEFEKVFFEFIAKNIEAFEIVKSIIDALGELLESSFGGQEAEKVKSMVDDVALKEHEVDMLQRQLLKQFFTCEKKLSFGIYLHWERVFEAIGDISNLSEKLANCIRMTLDVK
jgi:uncharacterized protein